MERADDAAKPPGRLPPIEPRQQEGLPPPPSADPAPASPGEPAPFLQPEQLPQLSPVGLSSSSAISNVWSQCEGVVRALLREDRALAFFFDGPMEESEAPGFAAATRQPMDFRAILDKLQARLYNTPLEVLQDARLIWGNVRAFFHPGSALWSFAERGEQRFSELWRQSGIDEAWGHIHSGASREMLAPQGLQQGQALIQAQQLEQQQLLPQKAQGHSLFRRSSASPQRQTSRPSAAVITATRIAHPAPIAGAMLPDMGGVGARSHAAPIGLYRDPRQDGHMRGTAPASFAVAGRGVRWGPAASWEAGSGPQLDDGRHGETTAFRDHRGLLGGAASSPAWGGDTKEREGHARGQSEPAGARGQGPSMGVPSQGGSTHALEMLRQALELHASSSEDLERRSGLDDSAAAPLPWHHGFSKGALDARATGRGSLAGSGRATRRLQPAQQGEDDGDVEWPRGRRQRRKLAGGLAGAGVGHGLPGSEQRGVQNDELGLQAREDGNAQRHPTGGAAVAGDEEGANSSSGSGRHGGADDPEASNSSLELGSSSSSEYDSDFETETEGGGSSRKGSRGGGGSGTSSGKGGGGSRGRGGALQQPGLCDNCRTTHSYTWRRHPTNRELTLCLACSMYTYRTGAMRPPEVWQKHQAQRGRKRQCFHCQATQAKHWYHHGEDRKDICVICWQYMRRHAGAMRPLEERPVTYDPRPYRCTHCGSTATSSWRLHPKEGTILCSACHQYMQKHNGQPRPEHLWQRTQEEQESLHWRRRKRGPRVKGQGPAEQRGAREQRVQAQEGSVAEELAALMPGSERDTGGERLAGHAAQEVDGRQRRADGTSGPDGVGDPGMQAGGAARWGPGVEETKDSEQL